MIFRQVHTETQRLVFATALDSLWRFDGQWNSDAMSDARSAAAAALLSGRPTQEVELVLDFFDQMALLVSRGALDDELVWYQFYWPMTGYWFASQDYIQELERDDPMRWEQLRAVIPRLVAIEAQRRMRTTADAVPAPAQIRDFLTSESEGGACQDEQDESVRKVPL